MSAGHTERAGKYSILFALETEEHSVFLEHSKLCPLIRRALIKAAYA
jgi:hypothetical protein